MWSISAIREVTSGVVGRSNVLLLLWVADPYNAHRAAGLGFTRCCQR
jgi:hypothetical protein